MNKGKNERVWVLGEARAKDMGGGYIMGGAYSQHADAALEERIHQPI